MKRSYIAERFSFDLDDETKDNHIVDDDLTKMSVKYNYFPKTKKELQQLLNKLIGERGYEADLNDIYTGYITDMSRLFSDLLLFINRSFLNPNISGWDVSNVEDMSQMFNGCKSFNQDISGWDVSNVKNKWRMFFGCDIDFNPCYKPF